MKIKIDKTKILKKRDKLKIKTLDGHRVNLKARINTELSIDKIARISISQEIEVCPYWLYLSPRVQLLSLIILVIGSELPNIIDEETRYKMVDLETVKRMHKLGYKLSEIEDLYDALFHITGKIADPIVQNRMSAILNYPKQTI